MLKEKLKHPHILSDVEVCSFFNVNVNTGLTEVQVEELRAIYGTNELQQAEKRKFLSLIADQFKDLLTRILIFAALISFFLALFSEEETGLSQFIEPAVILLILIANGIVSVWQECSAEKSLEALKKLQPELAQVLREGQWTTIQAKELVPGDIFSVHVGDRVPADGRIIKLKTISLRAEQSELTGETKTTLKEASTLDKSQVNCGIHGKSNILFASTTIAHGSGIAVVVATGMSTEIGHVQSAVNKAGTETEQTPLQRKLDEFGEILSKGIGVVCVLVWVINYKNFSEPSHGSFIKGCMYYFKTAIALAVAAIPEGLTAVITTCLALGTRKMAKKNAIVRRLTSVETLGCTTVICSDKTGTLTTNQMVCTVFLLPETNTSLVKYSVNNDASLFFSTITCLKDMTLLDTFPESEKAMRCFAACASLCNDASLFLESNGALGKRGDPTEVALKILVEHMKCPDARLMRRYSKESRPNGSTFSDYWESQYEKIVTLEFTRDRKSMSVICKTKFKPYEYVQFVKGAPESILSRCTQVITKDGSIQPITEAFKKSVVQSLNQMTSEEALRVLAFAFKRDIHPDLIRLARTEIQPTVTSLPVADPTKFVDFEQNMIFCGLTGIMDTPRPEVFGAIASCRQAGIRVIMITGDNKNTAEAIAVQIGIVRKSELKDVSFLGSEFEALSDADKLKVFSVRKRGAVFSRTEPRHKQMIIRILKALGEVTAMTGDGVNDAPALKQSDIGIAMGISGTEVAKEASDMVLADDNFLTIVEAIQEGRSIYNNMRAFIRYLISSNIGEVASIFLTAALGVPESFVPVQLLWVNLVTDGLPATALGFNPPDPDIMTKKPRKQDEPLITPAVLLRYVVIGLYVGFATVGIFVSWFVFQSDAADQHTLIPYNRLSNWTYCSRWADFKVNPVYGMDSINPCTYFTKGKIKASTLSLTVLVIIEMLNALNALSDENSLLTVAPWSNPWLLIAITASVGVHLCILHIPCLASIFGVVPLSLRDWLNVLLWSFPVVILDELFKFCARYSEQREQSRRKKSM